MLTEKDFINELQREVDEKNFQYELVEKRTIYKKMDLFRKFTQRCIDAGNLNMVNKCFHCAERFLEQGNFLLRNAVENTYIYGLYLDYKNKNHRKAKQQFPVKLSKVFTNFHFMSYP